MTLQVHDIIPYLDEDDDATVFIVDNGIRFDIDSLLASATFDRFVDRISGNKDCGIDIWLAEKENWE